MNRLARAGLVAAGAVAGALVLLVHGASWEVLARALGFDLGLITGAAPQRTARWPGDLMGGGNILAGALLGVLTAVLWERHARRNEVGAAPVDEDVRGFAWAVLLLVGMWSLLLLIYEVAPGMWAGASRRNARAFWQAQFVLTGVLLNPKLWWAALLVWWVERRAAAARARR